MRTNMPHYPIIQLCSANTRREVILAVSSCAFSPLPDSAIITDYAPSGRKRWVIRSQSEVPPRDGSVGQAEHEFFCHGKLGKGSACSVVYLKPSSFLLLDWACGLDGAGQEHII